jgi:hypothetical protein
MHMYVHAHVHICACACACDDHNTQNGHLSVVVHFTHTQMSEMFSLRANCRFQVRAVVVLSLPALGE